MNSLKVTLVQTQLHWENRKRNLDMFSELLEAHVSETDLIVLPEMFSTGFSMNPSSLAEPMEGITMDWMHNQANKYQCVITGSQIIEDKNAFYNRLIWMRPDGTYSTYDKRHLFTMAGENNRYRQGKKRLIEKVKDWNVCPLICYDLRFPVWSRNTVDYDLLIYTANWPKMRIEAWKTLLKARAIENQSYVIGVNRIGFDGNQYPYTGNSRIYDGNGSLLADLGEEQVVYTMDLSYEELCSIKEKLPFLNDRDEFNITENDQETIPVH